MNLRGNSINRSVLMTVNNLSRHTSLHILQSKRKFLTFACPYAPLACTYTTSTLVSYLSFLSYLLQLFMEEAQTSSLAKSVTSAELSGTTIARIQTAR